MIFRTRLAGTRFHTVDTTTGGKDTGIEVRAGEMPGDGKYLIAIGPVRDGTNNVGTHA